MGQYLKQRDERSQLQQRLDAELRAKLATQSKAEAETPDGVDDSAYIEGTKQTTSLDWVWLLIFFAVIGVVGYFIYVVSR